MTYQLASGIQNWYTHSNVDWYMRCICLFTHCKWTVHSTLVMYVLYTYIYIYYKYTHAYIYAYAVTLIFMQNHLRHLWSSIGADAPPGGREVCGTRSTSDKCGDKSAVGKCEFLVWKVSKYWRQISQRYLSGVGRCVFWGIHLDLSWQWLYMPASINFVVGVSQGRCQGGQGYIQTMVYMKCVFFIGRKSLNTRSCGCFLRGYPPFLTHLAMYYTHISPGVCNNSGCLSTLDSSWFFRSNIREGVTSIHKEGPCFI